MQFDIEGAKQIAKKKIEKNGTFFYIMKCNIISTEAEL